MTELALHSGRVLSAVWARHLAPRAGRIAVLVALAAMFASTADIRALVVQSMSDAFLAVTVFVAATLWIVYWAERLFQADLGVIMARHKTWQPAIAALLGATPGCGGAIIVVTQFVRGYASFGALISVLVATMGDAAFLLMAREPSTAALVIGVSAVAGTITGMIVDRIHGRGFLAVDQSKADLGNMPEVEPAPALLRRIWAALVGPGIVIGAMLAVQADTASLLGPLGGETFLLWFGAAGSALCLLMWAFSRNSNAQMAPHSPRLTMTDRVLMDTNFVTAWVVLAFLSYELAVHVFGTDVGELFQTWLWAMPLVGMLVGFVPGCGPQIVVTSLYLSGAIPLSAQFANAIANDGDALFPAIALAPRAAILATLYSAVPALIVGYGWFFLFE